MAAVLFTILKILGTILLVLLAIVFVLVLLVLFVPIRYLYKFCYNDEMTEINCHYVDVSWIFKLIKARVHISLSGVNFEIRIFGIRCKFIEKILQSKMNNDETDEDVEIYDELSDTEYTNISELFDDEETLDGLIEMYGEDEENKSAQTDDIMQDFITGKTRIRIKKNKRIGMYECIKKVINVLNPMNWLRILANKFRKFLIYVKGMCLIIIQRIKELCVEVKTLINKITLITEFLERPSTIRGIEKIKEYICITCKHILPRKKKVILEFGLDNPADTGQVLAVAGTVYPIVGDFVEVYPNFQDKELKVSALFKGRIIGISVVIIVIKVIRDKAIRRLIHNLNKLKEEL